MKRFLNIVASIAAICLMTGCHREPPLHLHRGVNVVVPLPMVNVDLNVFWHYDVGYDWEEEWTYGWDATDVQLFGPIGYTEPEDGFEVRSYYTGQTSNVPHSRVKEYFVETDHLTDRMDFGFYDLLAWTAFPRMDVQSVIIDESDLDQVVASTNTALRSRATVNMPRAHYQPEQLFAGYDPSMYVSPNLEDYDYYDEATNTYYMNEQMDLYPVTYIYLTQVRLHNNRGRIDGVDGEANLSGMARSVTLNDGVAGSDVISVHYNNRFKRNCTITQTGESVDVAGGRCLTFGIPNQNSSRVTRASEVQSDVRHYMDVNFIFNNGQDSTFIFDVTDQVLERYKGGVLTIDIDVDTLKLPTSSNGSGFDAVVKDYELKEYEFEM